MKTTILLATMTGLFLAIGYWLGGQQGALTALIAAAAMNIYSYWFSDSMVLRAYNAQPVTEAEQPQLYHMVADIAAAARIPMPRLYVIDLPSPNAFATGRNPAHAAVAVSRSIMQLLTPEELKGVLAHELSHITNRDILVSSVAATLAGALSYLAQFAYFGGNDESRSSALGGIVMLVLAPLVATLLSLAVSRAREYGADASGAHLLHGGDALASALQKLEDYAKGHPLPATPTQTATAHLFIVNPFAPSFVTALFSTHPPMEERIKRLRAMRG
jgi:heat shock protein HtpX